MSIFYTKNTFVQNISWIIEFVIAADNVNQLKVKVEAKREHTRDQMTGAIYGYIKNIQYRPKRN